jgi:cardiolipin synthase
VRGPCHVPLVLYHGNMRRKGSLGFTVLIAALLAAALGLGWLGLRGSSKFASSPSVEPLGSKVLCLVTPSGEARDLVVDDISRARKSVFVECYLISDPSIVEALCSARSRGCDVRILMEESPYGGFSMNDSVRNGFRSAGIDANWGNRVYSFTHAKFIVIDSTVAWVMTANLTKSAFDKNREVLVRSDSQDLVRDLVRVFWADRRRGPCNAGGLVLSPVNARGDLIELLTAAHSNVDVASEVLDDDQVKDVLEDLSSRGIWVRVLVASPDTVAVNAASRQQLERTGVAVRYLESPYLHAKYVVVDGRLAYVGSHNLSAGSLDENREVGVITDNVTVVRTIEASFSSDWPSGT